MKKIISNSEFDRKLILDNIADMEKLSYSAMDYILNTEDELIV